MAPEEKAGLCSGRDFRNTKPMERPGVPGMMVSDGSHGLRKQAGEADHPGRNAARNGGAAGINRLQTKKLAAAETDLRPPPFLLQSGCYRFL